MNRPTTTDYLHLHFLVLIWGFTAILGLLISVSALTLVVYRTLLAAVGLGVLLYVQKKMAPVSPGDRLKLLATGLVIALHWALFFEAARVANASVCLAGMATGSLWTSLLEPLFFRRRLRLVEVVLGIVVMAGLYLIFRFEIDRAVGLLMAVFSAMLASIFTIINSRFTRHYPAMTITFYEMSGAFGSSLLFLGLYLAFGLEKPSALWPRPADWLWISILAFVCTVYAYSASVWLMRKFSAFAINLTVNLEPVYGIMLAWLFFGDRERMTGGFYIGTLIILIAVLAYPALNRKMDKKYTIQS
ncbi:DMT family transporter [Larkinella rosea]|uniref:EamA family transporter n=1 Tax=Larkinella rosea TaxID=2025312 RepID=A0A3P1BUQ7_9BACT|nr:EamA family transporter [Larkinella rosea]RRB04845.1 EamA family transporter [Larkinella rosea]